MINKKFFSFNWYYNIFLLLIRVKLHFKNPPKNKLVIFDSESIEDLSQVLKNHKYFILENRLTNINNLYLSLELLKLIFLFYNGNFMSSYLKGMITLINPKNVVTFIDNSEKFFELAFFFKNKITFNAIQNGARYEVKENNYIFKKKKFLVNKNNKIFFDNYFCFGNYEKDLYKKNKISVKKFISIGSLRLLNYIDYRSKFKKNNVKKKFDICLLSDQDAWYSELDNSIEIKKGIILLLKYTLKFSKKYKLKLVISLKRQKNHSLGESFFVEEQNFYKDNLTTNEYLFAKKSFFHKRNKYNVYDLIKNSKVTIGTISTCLREALALKKKILACNYTKTDIYSFPVNGICKLEKSSYKIFEKRLLNIISMKFKDFEKKINQKSSYLLDLKKKNIVEKIISDSIN